MEFSTAESESREISRIVKSAVTPRPIAWISTRTANGVDNLAPFSSYNYARPDPPVVLFNSPLEDGEPAKDSARNAIDSGEFAVNIVTEANLEQMDHTSKAIPADESEFDLADVERADCRTISPPRVAESAVTMECTVHDTLEIHGGVMILGDVEHFHVADAVTTEGEIDAAKMDTMGRLGGPYYTVSRPVEFERQH